MKTLNLDALVKTNRTITLGGREYAVEEMTVENFIETTKAAEKLGSDASLADQMEAAIEMTMRSVPAIERDTLKKLSLDQLTTIVQFLRGDFDGTEPAPATEGEQPGK
jgi:hypothetical protein